MSVNGVALLTTICFVAFTAWVSWQAGIRRGEDRARRRYRVKRQMDNIRRSATYGDVPRINIPQTPPPVRNPW